MAQFIAGGLSAAFYAVTAALMTRFILSGMGVSADQAALIMWVVGCVTAFVTLLTRWTKS